MLMIYIYLVYELFIINTINKGNNLLNICAFYYIAFAIY